MPSRLDPHDADLRIGDWFTIDDEIESKPAFLRDPEESYVQAMRPSSCPPPGVPMRLIARHEHYLYASAMSWNGQEWCPAIVDLRRHEVVPLPKSIPEAIKGHLRRERQKNTPRQQQPSAHATEKSRRTLAREQAKAQQGQQNRGHQHQAAIGHDEAGKARRSNPAPECSVDTPIAPEAASTAASAPTATPGHGEESAAPRDTAADSGADTAWIRLSLNPRALGRDLLAVLRTLRLRRRRVEAPRTT